MLVLQIALAVPNFDNFSYLAVDGYKDLLCPGRFVVVELRKKISLGLITDLTDFNSTNSFNKKENLQNLELTKLKYILAVCSSDFDLSKKHLNFLKWLADYYLCSLGEVWRAALPEKFLPVIKNIDHVNSNPKKVNIIQPDASFLYNFSFSKGLDLSPILSKLQILATKSGKDNKRKLSISNSQIKKQALEFKIGPRNLSLILKLVDKPSFTYSFLQLKNYAFNQKQIEQLLHTDNAKLINLNGKIKLLDNPLYDFKKLDINLTEPQQEILSSIKYSLNDKKPKKPILIHGVTGSGKTEIYIESTKNALSLGFSVLILLPEIALTPQTIFRFEKYLGGKVLVCHSKLTAKQKSIFWSMAKTNQAIALIGTRSAIFSPLQNLGLIIIDEEHDLSFKQQNRPFYNARDLSLVLAKEYNALVVLGSATPSIESFTNSQKNRYQIYTLKSRPAKVYLPKINLVDLKKSRPHKNFFYLAQTTVEKIEEVLKRDKQVIFFLNRRGYSRVLLCSNCQTIVMCPNCSVPLTWHLIYKELLCHSCNFHIDWINKCPTCQNTKLRLEGIGTQRLALDLKNFFKELKVLRVDADSLTTPLEMEKSFLAIKQKKYQLIVGTQMLAKGHDFPDIGLVIVPIADLGLNIPDFRASERSFQLLSQVVGRAGRSPNFEAWAIVQSYNPSHPAIKAATNQDYQLFYDYEITKRRKLSEPPFKRLAIIAINDKDEQNAQNSAFNIYHLLKTTAVKFKSSIKVDIAVLEPNKAAIYKKNQRFEWEIFIKSPSSKAINMLIKNQLWQNKASKFLNNARLLIKIDP